MLRRILIPLDGSQFANAALAPAAALARKMDGELRLVHVLEVPRALAYPEYRAEDHASAERRLSDTAFLSVLAGVRVSTVVREGSVLEEIEREADAWSADAIVMTTHGRGGLARFWMGSVADRCVRSSARPVLLVRPQEGTTGGGAFNPLRVVVPLDGSTLAEAALPYATAVSKAFGAEVLLMRGVTHLGALDAAHLSFSPQRSAQEQREAEGYLRERAKAIHAAGVTVETLVVTHPGLPDAIASRPENETIVMTSHGAGGLERAVFGSVADKVVRSATCPVLVIRPQPREQDRDLASLSREIAEAAESVMDLDRDR